MTIMIKKVFFLPTFPLILCNDDDNNDGDDDDNNNDDDDNDRECVFLSNPLILCNW